eukprot:3574517-Prymnesium_polylepis.2
MVPHANTIHFRSVPHRARVAVESLGQRTGNSTLLVLSTPLRRAWTLPRSHQARWRRAPRRSGPRWPGGSDGQLDRGRRDVQLRCDLVDECLLDRRVEALDRAVDEEAHLDH